MNAGAVPLDVVQTLQAATRKAYADACVALERASPNQFLGEAQKLVLGVVHKTLQECARERNSCGSAVTRMPNELLVAVFEHLPFSGRVATSHVCHAWREASLKAPRQLWSVIEEPARSKVVEALFARAGPALVTVERLLVKRSNQKALARIIQKNLHRICDLHLAFNLREDDWWTEWDAVFNSPAPQLRALTLEMDEAEIDIFEIPTPIFGGNAPNLHVLRFLNGVCGEIKCIARLPAVTRLSLSCSSPINVDDVTQIFESFTGLSSMRLEGAPEKDMSDIVRTPAVPPPSLKRLSYRADKHFVFGIVDLVGAIDFSRIPVVHWSLPRLYLGPNSGLSEALFKGPILSAAFMASEEGISMRLVDSWGLVRIFMEIEFTPGFVDHFASLLRTVSELTISECISMLSQELCDALPAVTTLTVVEDFKGLRVADLPAVHFAALDTIRLSPAPDEKTKSGSGVAARVARLCSLLNNKKKIDRLELHGLLQSVPDAVRRIAANVTTLPETLEVIFEEEPPL